MSNSPSQALIRPLTVQDRPQWNTLWRAYLEFYDTVLPTEIYDTYFQRLLGDDPQDFHALVAEVDGELIGLVHFLFHRHGWKIENTCYLQDLFVSRKSRGTGTGRALIEAVYTKADNMSAPGVYWLTQSDNAAGRRLYDQVGHLTDFIKYQRPA